MYNFIDVNGTATESRLPEAFTINGVYPEDIVDGYRTLYSKGRDGLSAEVIAEDNPWDGAQYKSRRFISRRIVVGYQILASTPAQYRDRYNKLAKLLNTEQAKFIFDDEPSVYFVGTPTEMEQGDSGQLTVTGEFTIECTDPFKYSTTTKTTTGTTITNNGTAKVYPVITASFSAAASYAEIATGSKRIQLGASGSGKNSTLLRSATPGAPSYGTGSGWHGQNWGGSHSATYYRCYVELSMKAGALTQKGRIRLVVNKSSGEYASIVLNKDKIGDLGTVDFYLNGSLTDSITMDYGSSGLFANGGTILIEQTASEIIFNAGGFRRTYAVSTPVQMTSTYVYAEQYGTTAVPTTLSISRFRVYQDVATSFAGITNKMMAGDVVKVEPSTGTLYLNGLPTPELGQVGNSWNFTLQPGANTLAFATDGTATFTTEIRERSL